MATQPHPYQGYQKYHRPRPHFNQAASTPAVLGAGRQEDIDMAVKKGSTPTVDGKPLPSRPANHLQQQHCAHPKSFNARFDLHSTSPLHTEVVPLPDEEEEVLSTARPPLTSKFSFDNLTAMGENTESGGAFKRMVTKAWLQNITQAARNSTISSSSNPPSSQSRSNSLTGTHAREAKVHSSNNQISTSPSSTRQAASVFSNRFRRDNSREKETRSPSPTKQHASSMKGDSGSMIIGIPELVHPALGSSTLPNTNLGNGATRIGLPAEAFGMPDHRIYIPPASPPPRRSEDSVRSQQSSTSTAISYGSGCTTSSALSHSSSTNGGNTPSCASSSFGSARAVKHDRALPYLPLRLKHTTEEYGIPYMNSGLSPTEDVEQLVLTPQLPPESAKYVYRSLYPTFKEDKTEKTPMVATFRESKNSNLIKDEIPFGHSANSRPTSPEVKRSIKENKAVAITSPLSPAFASISPLAATRKITDQTEGSITHPIRSSSLSDVNQNNQAHTQSPSKKASFHAMLLQPIPSFPANISDEEKLINVHVGGSKVYTTRLSAITSHTECHLAKFLQENSKIIEPQVSSAKVEASANTIRQQDSAEKASKIYEARISDTRITPATVILNLPSSPIHALRSARASIYDDIPSDESDEGDITAEIFGNYANVKSFRDNLEVPLPPFPNPSESRLRFSRNHTGDAKISDGAVLSTANSSEYASTEADDDFILNFLDTTPDDENEDPFNLQPGQPSPIPSSASEAQKQEAKMKTEVAQPITTSLTSRYSNSSSSHIPSLSSSPNSSAYQVDSPILLSGGAKRLMEDITTTSGAFENLVMQHGQDVVHPINVYLDRSAESYDAIFHFLRAGTLPRKLCLNDAVYGSLNNFNHNDEDSIHSLLNSLPLDTRSRLMPLVLHPVMSELKDLKEEADYLGLSTLTNLCDIEISKLKKMVRWSRTVVAHPGGLHLRSESEGALSAFGAQQNSLSRLLGKHASRPRPRLVGHRQYDSESKVLPRPAKGSNAHDNWI